MVAKLQQTKNIVIKLQRMRESINIDLPIFIGYFNDTAPSRIKWPKLVKY